MSEQQTKEVARRILRLDQRANRAELLEYIKRLPKSVGFDWYSVGDDTFLIVPCFVSEDAPSEPSEFPVPMRVLLDETDAPMAMLRMWAARVIGDDHEGPADTNCGWGAEDVDAVEQDQPVTPTPSFRPRHCWGDIGEKVNVMIREDRTRLNWSCEKWANAVGVPRGTFSKSQPWKDIQYQQQREKDRQRMEQIDQY